MPRQRNGLGWLPLLLGVLLGLSMSSVAAADRPTVRMVKVLPQLLDKELRVALSPSLYERDAYQAQLRKNPSEQGGLRFDVQWKSSSTNRFKVRIEIRGNKVVDRLQIRTSAVLEDTVKYTGFFSTWSQLSITGEAHTRLGELSAWRATMWDGDRLVAEQKSFLW